MSSSPIEPIPTPTEFTKNEVIDLILKMRNFNQREYAAYVYKRENAAHPEWDLRSAFQKDANSGASQCQ